MYIPAVVQQIMNLTAVYNVHVSLSILSCCAAAFIWFALILDVYQNYIYMHLFWILAEVQEMLLTRKYLCALRMQ